MTIQEISTAIYELCQNKTKAALLAKEIADNYSKQKKHGDAVDMQMFLIDLSKKFSEVAGTEFILKPRKKMTVEAQKGHIQKLGELWEEFGNISNE